MEKIKKLMSSGLVVLITLFTMIFALNSHAMPTPQKVQAMWNQRQQRIKQEERIKEHMKESDDEYFAQLLETRTIQKEWSWFNGLKDWSNKVIIAAFELLDPRYMSIYESDYARRKDNIKQNICRALNEYGNTLWFSMDTRRMCTEINKKLDNLIEYSKNPQKIDDTFLNRQIYPFEKFESQSLYQQLPKERRKSK